MNKYLLVDASGLHNEAGELIYGFWYSLSDDLINWSRAQLLMKANILSSSTGDRLAYPSLIDPDDPSFNFEYTDQQMYLYYTRWHKGTSLDRDLVRVPVALN